MKATERSLRFGAFLGAFVSMALIASASFAATRTFFHPDPPPHDVVQACPPTDGVTEGTEQADGTDPASGTVQTCQDDQGEDPTEQPPAGQTPDPEREAACNTAAGIDPTADPGSTDGTTDEKPHGLDNAIQHVLANCIKNPQAPGLLNALERLAANKARHEAHDAWLAERKASQVHGHDAEHGGGHGNGNGNGHSH